MIINLSILRTTSLTAVLLVIVAPNASVAQITRVNDRLLPPLAPVEDKLLPPQHSKSADGDILIISFDSSDIDTRNFVGNVMGRSVFPVLLIDPELPFQAEPCVGTRPPAQRKNLDLAWLLRCLSVKPNKDNVIGHFTGTLAELRASVERANRTFFENGYINSGFLVVPNERSPQEIGLKLVVGSLVALQPTGADVKEVECKLTPRQSDTAITRRYIEPRLMRGCAANRPFNVYALERNFRRLADDQQTTVARLNLKLEPICNRPGRAQLNPASDNARNCVPLGEVTAISQPHVRRLPKIEIVTGFANARSPSIGSDRGYTAIVLRPLPGVQFEGEAGITAGALDGSAALILEASPRWTLRLRGDANDAEVVSSALRPLDISSKGQGFDATITYGAINCPLTPLFGDGQQRIPRLAFITDGIERCQVGARRAGDSPVGWSAGRDISASLSISHRASTSFLLGEPFSFAPGAVDGRSNVSAVRGAIDWLERGRGGRGGDRGWTFAARIQFSQGIDGSETDIAGLSAPSPNFSSFQAQLGYARELGFGGLVLTARLRGQVSGELLYTAERFAIGGINSVRGFAESSLLVDRGVAGSFELSRVTTFDRNRSPSGQSGDDPFRFRFGAFVDAGYGTTLTPNANVTTRIASTGVTAAWIPANWIELRGDYAVRLSPRLPFTGRSLAERGVHFALTIHPLRLFESGRNKGKEI